METLQHLYKDLQIPQPNIGVSTSWGSDPYQKGSYSFLPPGATNEDYQVLRYPINGKSASNIVDETDTMRLFWCGEHTNTLYPSTAHGAYLSGLLAAKEVVDSMFLKENIIKHGGSQLWVAIGAI